MSTAMAGAVPAYVTREILEEHAACFGQVELFARTFLDGGEVTAANIRRAAAVGLDLNWFADTFLPMPARRAYREATTPARRAYREAMAAARQARDEAVAAAGRAYVEAAATAWRAYDEAARAARLACQEAMAAAGRAYVEAMAAALIDVMGLAPGSGRSDS